MIATSTNIRAIRAIAENLNDTKRLVPYIKETEQLSIVDSLGAKIYKAIDTAVAAEATTLSYEDNSGTTISFDADEYDALLNGGYYTDDNDTYFCGGLIPAIAYLSNSRFIVENQLNITAFGAVLKNGQLSEPADTKIIQYSANKSEKIGKQYLSQVYEFIKFKEGLVCDSKKITSTKIRTIGD